MVRTRFPHRSERGAALLVAVVAIAVLTALAVDLAYETQVRLRISTNARDELRAEALAQSAVNVSRLVLAFQYQIDQVTGAASQLQSTSGTNAGKGAAGAGTAGTPATIPSLRPQLWNLVPISSALTQSLFGGAGAGATTRAGGAKGGQAAPERKPDEKPAEGAGPAFAAATYGDFEGGFQARIEDEGQKINVALDGSLVGGVIPVQIESLLRLTCDAKWDPLFDRTDADGQRYSRTDLLANLRNWASDDAAAWVAKVSFPAGNCAFQVLSPAFEKAFSDKNYPYDRGPDRYRTKNNRMDSLDELYQVAGVTDAFMAAFGDQLTAYLPRDAPLNVNASDPVAQLRIAKVMVDPAAWPIIDDPVFQKNYRKALSSVTMGGMISLSVNEISAALQAAGAPLRSDFAMIGAKAFTDRSVVYRIRALGVAGDVTHETEAVVSFDPHLAQQQNAQNPLGAVAAGQLNMGQLIHWHED